MSKNMDYIVYLNSFVDYKAYHSYSEVQVAVNTGMINPDPPAYREHKSCKWCGKFTMNTGYCNQSCRNKAAHHRRLELKTTSGSVIAKSTGKPATKIWEHIADILPLYNEGKSDFYIGNRLGLSDKYVLKIRRFFGIPANFGKLPNKTYDVSQLDYNPRIYNKSGG